MLSFFLINTCQDAPRSNPVDPENPDTDVIEPPQVQELLITQINKGFKLDWVRLDTSFEELAGYNIYKKKSPGDTVNLVAFREPEINFLLDTSSFALSDTGKFYFYDIRALHSSGLEGKARSSLEKKLITIPIQIEIEIQETIPGFVRSETVSVEIAVIIGTPNWIIASESKSFAGAEWQEYDDKNILEYQLSQSNEKKYIYVQCKDVTGKLSKVAEDSTILDTQPPQATELEIIPISNPLYPSYGHEVIGFTPSRNVLLKLKAQDAARWQTALNNETPTFPDNPPYTDYASEDTLSWMWTLASGTTTPVVYARFEDELGHVRSDYLPEATIEFDNTRPDANAGITINGGDSETELDYVTLNLSNNDKNIFLMNVSNDPSFSSDNWIQFNSLVQDWQIPSGNGYDTRAVYIKFMDRAGNTSSQYYTDDIILNPPPSTPIGLRVDTVYSHTIVINWDNNSENDFQKYIIYRGEGTTQPDSIGETTLDHYTDSELKNGTEYQYQITAVDITEKISAPSGTVAATPMTAPPEISIAIRKTIPTLTDTGIVDIDITELVGEPEFLLASESPSFTGAIWDQYSNPYSFGLSEGDGPKVVYVQVKDEANQFSNVAEDSVILDTSPPSGQSLTIIPVNNPLYDAYPLEVEGFTNNLNVMLLFRASDLTAWRTAINNENADFPPNPSFSIYTSLDSLAISWTLAPSSNLASVFARFEDNLNHIDYDFIPSESIIYDDVPPDENAAIIINDGELVTESEIVALGISNSDQNIFQMNISNTTNFNDEDWQEFAPTIQFWAHQSGNGYDIRTVYVRFRDRAGNTSLTYDDDIILNPPPASPEGLEIEEAINATLKIKWFANTENDIEKYIVYRSTGAVGPDSVGETTATNFSDSGLLNGVEYQYYITATDTTGKESSGSNPVIGMPINSPPIVRITINPSAGTRETLFTFDASNSTDDVSPISELEARWDFGGDGIWERNFSTENFVIDLVSFNDTGDIQIICEVRDGDVEQQAIGIKDTSLHINIPPGKPGIQVSGGPYYRKTDICVTAIATDPDGPAGKLKVRWILNADTLDWGEDGILQYCFQSDALGLINTKAQSKDEWEEPSPWSNTSTIQIVNKSPIAGFTILPASVGRRDDVFQFTTNSDLSKDEYTPFDSLLFEWRFSAEGNWTAPDTVKSIAHSYSAETSFVFDVFLRVTDSDGSSSISTRQVRINQPPSQPTLQASTTSTYKNTTITFTAVTSDPDGDDLEYYFDFGDELSGWTFLNPLPHSYDNSGTFDARVLVRDSWGDSTSWSPSIPITIENRPPNTPSNITVTPTTIYAGDLITVRAWVTDDDNDDVKLFIRWESGNVKFSNYVSSGSFVPLTNTFNSTGNRTISLYAQDTDGEQSAETSVTLNVITEGISKPGTPTGQTPGYTNTSYVYSTSGASSNAGHTVEYLFHWGDNTDSGWSTSLNAPKSWSAASTYSVTVEARCQIHINVKSPLSDAKTVRIDPETITAKPGTPTGPSSGFTNTSYSYSTSGTASNLGHNLEYRFYWDDGNSGWSTSLSANKSWSIANTYYVTVQARCQIHNDITSPLSDAKTVIINPETVSIPGTPSGPSSGFTNTSYSYSTSSATSNLGHTLEYRFYWGDGNNSAWSTSLSASKSWSAINTYSVTVVARCRAHNEFTSTPSNGKSVTINYSSSTIVVTFHGFDVIDDAEVGVGKFFWTFKVDVSSTQSLTVDEVLRANDVPMERNAPPTLWYPVTNKYVQFPKTNASGESFKIWFKFWEKDLSTISDDYLGQGGRTDYYPYNALSWEDQYLTASNGTQVRVWYSVSVSN